MSGQRTQLAVIGAGPGGYPAAFRAAQLGMKVTLIDQESNPGGVCLYRGCIPSKVLLHAARIITEARDARRMGIGFEEPSIDLDALRKRKDKAVARLSGGVGQLCKARGVDYVRGTAHFRDANRLDIDAHDGNTAELAFDQAVIATGSLPVMLPGLPDDDRIMDSSRALDLPDVPARLLVVGGGFIGLGLGAVYAALGSKVHVVEMTAGLLPGTDPDLTAFLQRRLKKQFAGIMVNTKMAGMRADDDGLRVRFEGAGAEEKEMLFDRMLIAVGRKPNTATAGLDAAGVETNERGFIPVDGERRTNVPHIFAVGDIAGDPMLAHKATREGIVAAEAAAGRSAAYDPRAVPSVVYTDPAVAWAGITEEDAKKRGIEFQVTVFPWAASGRAVALGRTDGATKLIVAKRTQRIIGVGIAGTGADELIGEGVLAVEMGATATDLAHSIHPHPTLSDTVMEAAELVSGQSTHYTPR